MNNHILETVRRLSELHLLEDRLCQLQPNRKDAAAIDARIAALRAQVPPGVLVHHDRLRARGKRSVAEVHEGVCGGCHMRVAIGLLPVLRRRDGLIPCQNCGRLLVLPEEDTGHRATTAPAERLRTAVPR